MIKYLVKCDKLIKTGEAKQMQSKTRIRKFFENNLEHLLLSREQITC